MIDPKLPFIDLHRHLEGCVRLETMLDLASQHGLHLPGETVETLRPHVVMDGPQADLVSFLDHLHWMIYSLADLDACRRIAYESVEDAAKEGIDYLELRFSPLFMAQPHKLAPADVVAAVVDGVKAGERQFGVMTRLIGIMSRTYGPKSCQRELEALLAHRHELRALDLAGDEARWPGELFHNHFRLGRDAGWQITVHAGEAGGAANVRYAIEQLGATRIGHGIRATEDPELLDIIRERGIGLEINLTSNLQTNTVSSLDRHPIAYFLDQELLATINTDDPIISGIDLRHEFANVAPLAGVTPTHARRAQENALTTAFLSGTERSELITRFANKAAVT
ncbi:adenosine deaminase [Pelagicoccus sp. SDUM812002]|uniref:adenosine deaminase n=1 Tax=Pelagicoccus sp. SDUM812002 TaxID=3041266 RepID=UPI00280F1B92|nr:adenosine deaminase [Pelagicoccus sp. SDUM812002]MDQ8184976.1 adenosine deaminase [Pelagicoccus sp. SDUM812002]